MSNFPPGSHFYGAKPGQPVRRSAVQGAERYRREVQRAAKKEADDRRNDEFRLSTRRRDLFRQAQQETDTIKRGIIVGALMGVEHEMTSKGFALVRLDTP